MSEVIIALDFQDSNAAINMVKSIGSAGTYYKVGLELFISEGHIILPKLKDMGKKIFLDLKLHDIPNTASQALKSCLKYDIDMVNLHVQGGTEMMKMCADVVKSAQKRPLLIGVTLLTSLDDTHLKTYKINANSKDYVVHMASLAKECGLDGVVSSAQETVLIKEAAGSEFLTVTPGIRLADDAKGDQKRILTPEKAAQLGTDYMVIGRSITGAKDPKSTTESILKSIEVL